MATDKHDHDDPPSELPEGGGDGELYGVLAEFDTPGELVAAARKVRDAGYKDFDCFSPFPVHGIDEAMGIKRTILPVLILGGGFAGTLGGLLLQWWCNAYDWPWNVAGKPDWSIPANIPIAFETTILLAVFTSFFGMWILNKLPQVWHPFFRLERFGRASDDAFLLGIEAKDERFELARTTQLLKEAGALEVDNCYLETDPARKNMPKWITAFIVASTAFALIPFAIAAKARNSTSSEPHIHIFPDMDFQPKFKAATASDLFPDRRANRGHITGTVARGSLDADDLYYRGQEYPSAEERATYNECKDLPEDKPCWTRGFPKQLEINQKLVARGQDRFNIYCSPCHGYDGRGEGNVPQRVAQFGGNWLARNLVEAPNAKGAGGVAVQMPNGQLFNTISNGFNTMMGYASQIPVADRWAIVLYVRSLQRAANATLDDVPQEERGQMMAPTAPAAPAPATPATPAPAGAPEPPATPAGGAPTGGTP